jgi:hypothetical protein
MTESDVTRAALPTLSRSLLAIAEEHFTECLQPSGGGLFRSADGGLLMDPAGGRSFRAALVTIAFAAAYLEVRTLSAVHMRGGDEGSKEHERSFVEARLSSLGHDVATIAPRCQRLRAIRRELLHEKPHTVLEQIFVA